MVHAKYRVLGIRESWNDQVVVDAAPIMPRTRDWPDEENSEENARFWSATPAGKLTVTYENRAACPVKPDQGLYIDLERAEGAAWALHEIRLREGCVGVSLYECGTHEGRLSGELTMEIDIAAAWPPFVQAGPGSRWRVVLRPE